jgi:flavodoxin
MNKKLVAYFSASGVTQNVALDLAKAAGADTYQINPEEPYTPADLDWQNKKSRSTVEMNNPASRPAISGKLSNMADYDTVFIGFPIWWGVAPTIIDTFLESYDFSGKTIIPFATSGSSGMGNTEKVLQKLCGPSVNWKPGKMLNNKPTQEALSQWVKSLNI